MDLEENFHLIKKEHINMLNLYLPKYLLYSENNNKYIDLIKLKPYQNIFLIDNFNPKILINDFWNNLFNEKNIKIFSGCTDANLIENFQFKNLTIISNQTEDIKKITLKNIISKLEKNNIYQFNLIIINQITYQFYYKLN
jgi:hypothetical protein